MLCEPSLMSVLESLVANSAETHAVTQVEVAIQSTGRRWSASYEDRRRMTCTSERSQDGNMKQRAYREKPDTTRCAYLDCRSGSHSG